VVDSVVKATISYEIAVHGGIEALVLKELIEKNGTGLGLDDVSIWDFNPTEAVEIVEIKSK